MPLQRLSPLDSAFLHLETPSAHIHIGGLGVFEAGPKGSRQERYQALLRQVESRLHLMPRYRQKLATLPLNLDEPVWVDDEDFSLDFHVRRAALPSPGGDRELCQFVEQVFSRPLDRRRPLWELYCIEGLEDGRWAILTKTHHCVVDGLSVLALATLLLDPSADYEPPSEPAPWEPDPGPGTLGMLFETARERVMEPARFVMSAAGSDLHPLEAARTVVEGGGGLANLVQHLDMSSSPINGPTGPTRAYGFSRFSLSDFKGVKNAFGATINDVALAVVSGGFRKYLEQRGEDVDTLHLKALCPVSLRDDSQESPSGNELSMMLVPLATEEALPAARMRRAKFQVEAMKRDKQAVGADMLRRFASSLPGPLHPLLAKGMGKLAGFNTIVTNIPGPQLPLYCLGCRMVEAMPVAFLYDGQRLAVAILSYDGDITFGYISDGVALPDVDCLSASMEESFRELAAVTRGGKSAVSQRGKSNGVPEFAGMGPPRT